MHLRKSTNDSISMEFIIKRRMIYGKNSVSDT